MVTLNKIYTRTGDDGTTALADGSRRAKYDLRIAAYGAVDEANAAIGMARLHTAGTDMDPLLTRLQNDLFDLGADLATPYVTDSDKEEIPALRIVPAQVSRLEQEIDQLTGKLSPLTSFILPGGSPAAAYLHMARTIIRRAERHLTEFADRHREEVVNETARQYVNRVSDLLFVAARMANNGGADDVLWQPGANRPE